MRLSFQTEISYDRRDHQDCGEVHQSWCPPQLHQDDPSLGWSHPTTSRHGCIVGTTTERKRIKWKRNLNRRTYQSMTLPSLTFVWVPLPRRSQSRRVSSSIYRFHLVLRLGPELSWL